MFLGEVDPEDETDQEVCIAIPPDLLEDIKKGTFNLLLEPGGPHGLPIEFKFMTVAATEKDNQQECTEPVQSGEQGSANDSETELGGDSEGSTKPPKKRGIGSCHKGGNLKPYSLWLKEYDAGLSSNFPSLYTQEELKKMYSLKGGGKKLADQLCRRNCTHQH